MFFLALKNLLEQRFRLAISAFGVGLSVMMILVMWAILEGVIGQSGAYVKNTDAQVWVVQKGFTDIAHGFSVVPLSLKLRLERISGVKDVNPITGARTEVKTDDGKDALSVIGYDTRTGVGGPWRFASDPAAPKAGEIVIDETFAQTAGFSVGDDLPLPDHPRKIVALTAGTNQFTNQLAFGELRDVRTLVRLRGDVNFYAVRTDPGRSGSVIAEIKRDLPDVTPFDKDTFVVNNEREIKEGFQPILYVMVGIAFLVGLAIVGLMMYTAAIEKAREYGVLTAIGAHAGQLTGIILRQAAITSALGFVVGCALVVPAGWAIGVLAPKTELEYPPLLFAVVAAASLVMALLASVVPIRRLARLDPAAVFRA